jgi:NAD+ kinase
LSATRAEKLAGPIRRVGVVLRERTPEIEGSLEHLKAWLEGRSVSVTVERLEGRARSGEVALDLTKEKIDLLIALGGDGTLLRAARSVLGKGIPVLGVNLGRLGFLTAFPADDLETGLGIVMSGEALLDPRFALRARIESKGEAQGDNFFALNDIVVHTSGAARVTPLALEVGSGSSWEEVGTFAADGVILSTPTGSTAYSMSAGGPILVPGVDCIVVTPICPHSLAVRPLVMPASAEIRVSSPHVTAGHQVTVDGQVERALEPGESVVVAREATPVALVRLPGQTFFKTMRHKLNWAARLPERA